jgi:hypothetical protein
MLPVKIDSTALDMAAMSTWMTDIGPFDVLAGRESRGRSPRAPRGVLQGDGFMIRTAGLEDIITAKERADRPNDREALPGLRAIPDAGKS